MQAGGGSNGTQKKRTGLTQEGSDDETTIQTERRRVPQPQQPRYNKPRIIERRNGKFCSTYTVTINTL